jgi:hypothetical protein
VVSFRAQAAGVISASATQSTDRRAVGVMLAFLASGAAPLLVTAVVPGRRRRESTRVRRSGAGQLPLIAAAVMMWEVLGVAAGGSYWLHYLLGTVPGLVLVVATAARIQPQRLPSIAKVLVYAGIMAVLAVASMLAGSRGPDTGAAVSAYLRAHSGDGDTAVVAFGDPAILRAAHLSSPYPQLWSLPVRVRDPQLRALTGVLAGSRRPTWVGVDGAGLATWGVDATAAQPVLDHEYRLVHVDGNWHIYHVNSSGSAP